MEGQNREPVVSIITPSYNQGRFIEETIQSVLNQNYPNLEYIIIDGGSTDESVEIIKKYEKYLAYWVSEKDRGQSDAINKGFRMAKGEILAWLNSDDTYLPGAVSKVVEYFDAYPKIGMVYGKTYFIDECGNIIGKYPTEPFDYKKLAMFTFITQPSTFFQRKAYFEVGGLNLDLHYTMDYDLWVRIAKIFKVEYLPDFLSAYRLHIDSKTVSDVHSLKFQEEYLKTIMRYYSWAPANRLYGYCYHLVKCKLPAIITKIRPLLILITLIVSFVGYIILNRGIRLDDIKMINKRNIKKLFKEWMDIYKEY